MNSVSINFTLKPLSKTRWESRIDALKPLRYQLGDIYDALINISDWSSLVQRHSYKKTLYLASFITSTTYRRKRQRK